MSKIADYRIFDKQLSRLIAPFEEHLAVRLEGLTNLHPDERRAFLESATEAMYSRVARRLNRLLILELNVARAEGRLEGDTPQERWQDFNDTAETQIFWEYCFGEYPDLLKRLEKLLSFQCNAITEMAARWSADRDDIAAMFQRETVSVEAVSLGEGDTHKGGRTVSILSTDAGKIVYKPRSLSIDVALSDFLAWLTTKIDSPLHFIVPDVIVKNGYGWARFVSHEYAESDKECARFYRGIGQILAVMRMMGGTDLHAENLIAHRGTPVLVDCETLFTPNVKPIASGYGSAYDHCLDLARGGVLAIGILPDRGQGLGWRGIDMSGVGGLSGQQPKTRIPAIVDAGLDTARVEMVAATVPVTANHPSRTPAITLYWPDIIGEFKKLSEALCRLDEAKELEPALSRFSQQQVRVVARPTESYAEIERMLWHPSALANPEQARKKAEALMAEMAENIAYAPDDVEIISAEVEELRHGDIPVFTTRCDYGALTGPSDKEWLPKQDLVAVALESWRSADLQAEASFIQASVVSAYVSDGHQHSNSSLWVKARPVLDFEERRRKHAEQIMAQIVANAHREDDNTIAWVAPILTPAGWSVSPLDPDLYAGLSGIALVASAYLGEVRANRANYVEGLEDTLNRLEHTLALAEKRQLSDLNSERHIRPPSVGGYAGIASQIWTLLTLDDIQNNSVNIMEAPSQSERVRRALQLVAIIESDAEIAEDNDLLYGLSGAIPPLLQLASHSGDEAPMAAARKLAAILIDRSIGIGDGISWPIPFADNGIGGFSHGTTGIGWAFWKLGEATGDKAYFDVAERAFIFEDSLFDPDRNNWRDLREIDGVTDSVAWCHGAVGIGLAHLDMHPRLDTERSRSIVQTAINTTFDRGLGWNHCMCHGDFGAWDIVSDQNVGRELSLPMTTEAFCASLLASLDRFGPTCGVTRDAFLPGLFTGHGGIIYQLLRMHPDCALPSALVLGKIR